MKTQQSWTIFTILYWAQAEPSRFRMKLNGWQLLIKVLIKVAEDSTTVWHFSVCSAALLCTPDALQRLFSNHEPIRVGKRIVQLQASLELVQNPGDYKTEVPSLSVGDRRKVIKHAALQGLQNLTLENRGWFTNKSNVAKVAQKYGLLKVLRWAPVRVRFPCQNSILQPTLQHC